jgi:hypothetical protein
LDNEKKNLFCVLCNKKYSSINSYFKHKKNLHNKVKKSTTKYIVTDNTINNNNTNIIINKIDTLEEKIDSGNQKVVKVVNKAITKASSLIKYLMEHHKSVPPLCKINHKKCINILRLDYDCPLKKENDYILEKTLIYEYTNNELISNISKFPLLSMFY